MLLIVVNKLVSIFHGTDLRFLDGSKRIPCSMYYDFLIRQNGKGIVEGVIDLRGLLPDEEIAPDTDVLNGIAYDAASERIFVTRCV